MSKRKASGNFIITFVHCFNCYG